MPKTSLVATLSISLTVPLSILADILWKEKRYGPLFFAGAVPMFCSYFIVALLTHFEDWDPLLDLLRFAQFYRFPLLKKPTQSNFPIPILCVSRSSHNYRGF